MIPCDSDLSKDNVMNKKRSSSFFIQLILIFFGFPALGICAGISDQSPKPHVVQYGEFDYAASCNFAHEVYKRVGIESILTSKKRDRQIDQRTEGGVEVRYYRHVGNGFVLTYGVSKYKAKPVLIDINRPAIFLPRRAISQNALFEMLGVSSTLGHERNIEFGCDTERIQIRFDIEGGVRSVKIEWNNI